MSLISFIKEAGEKLFGKGEAKAAQEAAEREASAANVERLNKPPAMRSPTYITAMNLKVEGLDVTSTAPRAPSRYRARPPTRPPRRRWCCAAATSRRWRRSTT